MSKIDELNKIETTIKDTFRMQSEIADLRLAIIKIEKSIISLIENSHFVAPVEKYLATINDHMYYNKREKKFMKIFSVRKGKITEIFEEIIDRYIGCPSHSRDSFSMDPVRYIPLLKEEYAAKRKVLSKYSLSKEAYSYRGGNSHNYNNGPRIANSKEYEPNFAKFIVIIQWSVDEKGNVQKSVHCKTIKAEWFLNKTKQNLVNSIFGTKHEWKVSKQNKILKKCFKKVESSLDLTFGYKEADALDLIGHMIFLLMEDYLEKITTVRKNSSRFGL